MGIDPNAPTLALDRGDAGPDGTQLGEWVSYVPTAQELKENGLSEVVPPGTALPALVTCVYDAEKVVLRVMPNPDLAAPFEVIQSPLRTDPDAPKAGGWYRASDTADQGDGGRGDGGSDEQLGA